MRGILAAALIVESATTPAAQDAQGQPAGGVSNEYAFGANRMFAG